MSHSNKVIRKPLSTNKTASLHELPLLNDWEVITENKSSVSMYAFSYLDRGESLLHELKVHLSGQRRPNTSVLIIRGYIEYVAECSGSISAKSLESYIKVLHTSSCSANTFSQKVSILKRYINHLMLSEIIPREDLVQTPKMIPKKSKASFYELASKNLSALRTLMLEYDSEITNLERKRGLEANEAQALFFSKKCMKTIHMFSLHEINKAIEDISFFDSVVKSMTHNELDEYKKITRLSQLYSDTRDLKQAFSVLYSKYIQQNYLPSSGLWPLGLLDYFKTRGWSVARVKNEFEKFKLGTSFILNDIANSISAFEIENYKQITDWRRKSLNQKSVELCFKILFAHFKYFPPRSTLWPHGIVDYLKRNGWPPSRVRSAIFPDTRLHEPLLVALISHSELCPNVDSAFKYTYLNSVSSAFEDKKVRFVMEKMRGAGVDKVLSESDQLMKQIVSIIDLIKCRLQSDAKTQKILIQEHVSIFIHLNNMRSANEITIYDSSTSANFVERAIKRYAEKCNLIHHLSQVGVRGENFRPTHAVIDRLDGVAQHQIQQKLNHKNFETTDGYLEKVETNSLLSIKQKTFQEYLIQEAGEVANKLKKEDIKSKAEPKENNFPRRVTFYNSYVIAEWVAHRDKIIAEKDRLIFNNPARWESYWLKKLGELDGFLSLVSSRDFHKAKLLAESIEIPHLD